MCYTGYGTDQHINGLGGCFHVGNNVSWILASRQIAGLSPRYVCWWCGLEKSVWDARRRWCITLLSRCELWYRPFGGVGGLFNKAKDSWKCKYLLCQCEYGFFRHHARVKCDICHQHRYILTEYGIGKVYMCSFACIPTGGKYSVRKMKHRVGYRCSRLITVLVLKSTIQDALVQEKSTTNAS